MTTRVEKELFFDDIDELMEEHFWVFTKMELYKERNPSFKYGLTITINEKGYSLLFYAEASTKDNTKNC